MWFKEENCLASVPARPKGLLSLGRVHWEVVCTLPLLRAAQ